MDAELVTLAVLQPCSANTSEARWLPMADRHLRQLFPYLPGQPGYNKPAACVPATRAGSGGCG